MRKIRDVLRLSAAGISKRKIAGSLGVSATGPGTASGGRGVPASAGRCRNVAVLGASNYTYAQATWT
jgi:hypothetical protein